jgi:hypothetical protein
MKRSPYFFAIIMFSLSNLTNASIHTSPNQTIDHYGTGNDGDNTSGLLLKNPPPTVYSNSISEMNLNAERIDHYGTGNDGDNTSGLLLKNPPPTVYSNSISEMDLNAERIDHYGTGNDGDNTSSLLLKNPPPTVY